MHGSKKRAFVTVLASRSGIPDPSHPVRHFLVLGAEPRAPWIHVLEGVIEMNDSKSAKGKRKILLVCDLAIAPGEPIVVRIPATDPLAASGPLSISYEQVSTLGGHWSSATLVVNEKTPGTG